jgi:nitroreductase
MAETMLELIANRRVVRVMTDEPGACEDPRRVLDAGRWSATGGNARSVRFVAVEDPTTLRPAAPPAEQIPMCAPKVTWRDLTHWGRYEVAEGGPRG